MGNQDLGYTVEWVCVGYIIKHFLNQMRKSKSKLEKVCSGHKANASVPSAQCCLYDPMLPALKS